MFVELWKWYRKRGTVTGLSLDDASKLTSTWLHSYDSNSSTIVLTQVSGKQRNNSGVHYNGTSVLCAGSGQLGSVLTVFRFGFLILGWEHLTTISLSVKAKL